MEYEVDFREQAVDDSALHCTVPMVQCTIHPLFCEINCIVVGLGRVGVTVGTGLKWIAPVVRLGWGD